MTAQVTWDGSKPLYAYPMGTHLVYAGGCHVISDKATSDCALPEHAAGAQK